MSELNFDMLKWQHLVYASKARFKIVVAGRRCGKTRNAAIVSIIKALECPVKDAGVLYAAPTLGMARTLMWDLLLDIGKSVIAKANINSSEVTLINGVKIFIRGADNPDSLRGMKLYYAVLDESKDFKTGLWEMVIRPALSDMEGGALLIGTPEPGQTEFRAQYDRGQSGEDPEWESWQFTTADNELINPKEIESARRSMSTFAFNQEYMASFDTMGANIFKEEWFKYGEEPREGDYYIAVDLAGFEAVDNPNSKKQLDDTSIAVVKITPDGQWWVKKIEAGRWDVRETAVRILMAIRTYRPISIGIEKGSLMRAVMPYLTDLMRKNSVYVHVEPISTSGNSKTNRVVYALQGLFEHGRITLNKRENWTKFKTQLLMFPSPRVHDDMPDSLSMIAHLSVTSYAKAQDDQEYEVIDDICGF
jgi:phage terminase large subunit-like protein